MNILFAGVSVAGAGNEQAGTSALGFQCGLFAGVQQKTGLNARPLATTSLAYMDKEGRCEIELYEQ